LIFIAQAEPATSSPLSLIGRSTPLAPRPARSRVNHWVGSGQAGGSWR